MYKNTQWISTDFFFFEKLNINFIYIYRWASNYAPQVWKKESGCEIDKSGSNLFK